MLDPLALSALIVSCISASFSFWAIRQVRKQYLFSGFQQANQATIEHPKLLNEVHGLNLNNDECREIAYLSVLMDAFQHDNRWPSKSNFLDRITAVPKNRERWEIMKTIYYGDYDATFIQRIDSKFESNSPATGNK